MTGLEIMENARDKTCDTQRETHASREAIQKVPTRTPNAPHDAI